MKSNIGWTKYSWNPYTWNCTKVSPACKNCYMFDMARNLRKQNAHGVPKLRERAWGELGKFAPGPVFVNSMSDTYHEGVPQAWIHRIHNTARNYPHLTFLLLTKRIEHAAALAPYLDWPPNLWIGTTVEGPNWTWRLDYLRGITQAAGRFVSFEPLLAYINAPDLSGIDWAIVGGESGVNKRPFLKSWGLALWSACLQQDVPFFYKQGSHRMPGRDRVLLGQTYDAVPDAFNWQAHNAA